MKGGSTRMLRTHKFYWMGCKKGTAGVGILVAKRWIDNILEARRVRERILIIRA